MKQAGFTLIELLVVIAILAVLAAVVITAIDPRKVQDEAKFAQTKQHLQTLATALETYTIHSGGVYPADVDRGIPPGLESYLKTGDWPNTPWGGPSTYDWDNYIDDDTGQQVYQFSVRFCQLSNPANCSYPQLAWAEDFDYHSSVYVCLQGPCKAHPEQPADHPGYCINCGQEED